MKPSTPRIEVIDIPWIGPSLNKIWAGVHWNVRKKIADEAHQAVMVATRKVEPFKGPVELGFLPFIGKGNRFDVTNYALTAKGIEDGLVVHRVIDGDGFKIVRKVTLNCPVRRKGDNYMRVTIAEAVND